MAAKPARAVRRQVLPWTTVPLPGVYLCDRCAVVEHHEAVENKDQVAAMYQFCAKCHKFNQFKEDSGCSFCYYLQSKRK
jgi:hypothetical protein